MNLTEHRARLLQFLQTVATPGTSFDGVSDDTNLVRAGVLDSFALIQIILHLEEVHQIDVRSLHLDPSDLISIRGMLAAIERGTK